MKKILLITILIISFFNSPAFAENCCIIEKSNYKKIDFKEAILMALENNHEVRAMKNNLKASEKDIGITRSYFMPRILFVEGFISTNDPTLVFALKLNQARFDVTDTFESNHPGSIGNFLTSGIIFLPIFNKKTFVGYKMAKKQYSANGYTYLRKQEEIMKNVAQAYLMIGTAQEYIQMFTEGLKDTNDHLKIAEAHYKKAGSTHPDVLEAKTKVFEAQQKLIFAQKKLALAQKGLGTLLACQNPIEISNTTPILEVKSFDYYKCYSKYRTDVRAMEINVENAKNNIKLEQADWYPNLNAIAAYNLWSSNYPFGVQGNDYIAGVFFTWSVFDGNKRVYAISKAKFKCKEAGEYLAGLRDLVDFKVFEAYSNVEETQKKLELATLALKTAREAELLITKKWEKNLVPFVDILEAQTELDQAREEFVKNYGDLRAQIINLYYESGLIREELILAPWNKCPEPKK